MPAARVHYQILQKTMRVLREVDDAGRRSERLRLRDSSRGLAKGKGRRPRHVICPRVNLQTKIKGMISASYTPIIFRTHMDLPSGDGWRCVRHRQRHLNSQAPDCLSARYIAENHGVGRWPHSIAWPKQYRPAGGELHYPLTTPTLIFSDSPPPVVNKDPRTAMSSNGSAGGLERLLLVLLLLTRLLLLLLLVPASGARAREGPSQRFGRHG